MKREGWVENVNCEKRRKEEKRNGKGKERKKRKEKEGRKEKKGRKTEKQKKKNNKWEPLMAADTEDKMYLFNGMQLPVCNCQVCIYGIDLFGIYLYSIACCTFLAWCSFASSTYQDHLLAMPCHTISCHAMHFTSLCPLFPTLLSVMLLTSA